MVVQPTGRHVKREKKINVTFPAEAGLLRNPVVSPGGLLTAQRGKPSLCSYSTVSVKEGGGSSGQVTWRQVLKSRSVPCCSPGYLYSNKLLIKHYSHGGLVYPLSSDSLGSSSLIPCGPLGLAHMVGTSHLGKGDLHRLSFPLCASAIKNDPSKANGGLAKA